MRPAIGALSRQERSLHSTRPSRLLHTERQEHSASNCSTTRPTALASATWQHRKPPATPSAVLPAASSVATTTTTSVKQFKQPTKRSHNYYTYGLDTMLLCRSEGDSRICAASLVDDEDASIVELLALGSKWHGRHARHSPRSQVKSQQSLCSSFFSFSHIK